MNKHLILLFIFFGFLSCKTDYKEKFYISGNIAELANDTIFLKKYDHFDFLDKNYILDSIITDSTGSFQFEIKSSYPNLVTLATHPKRPYTYQVLEDSPHHFYYSMCKNFLGMDPTLYIENNKNYTLKHWDKENELKSVVYDDKNLNKLRAYYNTVDFRVNLRDENRERLNLPKEKALELILKERDFFINKYALNKPMNINSFEYYFKTEVTLGALNEFLQWYGSHSNRTISDEFYKNLMSNYTMENWHPNSLEYFKFNEHYVNYLVNSQAESNEVYKPVSNLKIQVAKNNCNKNIEDIYTRNLTAKLEKN